jgi:uncharacterized membrane protein YsdA (DUF1294 family)
MRVANSSTAFVMCSDWNLTTMPIESAPMIEESSQKRRAKGVRTDGISLSVLLALVVLLSIPAIALVRLSSSIDWRILVGVPVVVSLYTFFAYRSDKRRAQAGEWRIPESTLHTAELLGGWPGGFLAQRAFRHKTSKASFQFTFWLIVFVHEYLAFDWLLQWKFTSELMGLVGR